MKEVEIKVRLRNQPDTLAKLCARHGKRILRLMEGTRQSRRESLNVKLIRYYTELEGGWSREREKQDWDDRGLASLKYDTYRIAIKVLAQAWLHANDDIYQELREIQCALDTEGHVYAADLCATTTAVAIAREEWGLALHIIDLWRKALAMLVGENARVAAFAEVEAIHGQVLARQAEVDQYANWRITVMDPIKHERSETDHVSQDKIETLNLVLARIRGREPKTKIAMIDHLTLFLLGEMLNSNLDGALEISRRLMKTYKDHSFLIDRRSVSYIHHFHSHIVLSGLVSNKEEAFDSLAQLETLGTQTWAHAAYARYFWLRSALQLSLDTNESLFFDRAFWVMQAEEEEILAKVPETLWLRLYWLAMLYMLRSHRWRDAFQIGQRIIGRKTLIRRKIVVSARIACFTCEIMLYPSDSDRIEYSYKAHYSFLRRNLTNFPEGVKILRAFQRLWLFATDFYVHRDLDSVPFPSQSGVAPKHLVEDFGELFNDARIRLKELQSQQ
jgi:hypothetical protein